LAALVRPTKEATVPAQTVVPRTPSDRSKGLVTTDRLKGLVTTLPGRRHVKVGMLVGLIAGVFGGFIKLGWEVVFPPRVASRTPEPTVLLHQLGISAKSTYSFSSHNIEWATLVIHFGFSIAFAVLYVVIAEYSPRIKLWMGAAFGIAVWIGAHMIVMPILGLTPHTFSLPWDEDLSEFFGHIVWMVAIEIVRRDLRSRITHEPDAEIALPISGGSASDGAVPGGRGAVVVGRRVLITGRGKVLAGDGAVIDGNGAAVDGALHELASEPVKPG